MLSKIRRHIELRNKRVSRNKLSRQRRLQTELLEDRRLLAVGDLVGSLIPASTPQTGSQEGFSVAASDQFFVTGKPRADVGGFTDSGAVEVYDAVTNDHLLTINNPTPASNDLFGSSVAISGDTVVVGAHFDDTGGVNTGSAYVYDLSSGSANPSVTLNNLTSAANDLFGYSVAISGNTIVVGAIADAGSAYVYDWSNGGAALSATIDNPSPASGDQFGLSVAVSGHTVAVGAYKDDTGATDAGAAYVFDLSSGSPTLSASIFNPTPEFADEFGYSLGVSGDTLVVGARGDNTGSPYAGSVYLYDLGMGAATLDATINNPTPSTDDLFGHSVDINGNTVIVGAFFDDTGATNAGSAYVYELSSGSLTLAATISNPAPTGANLFGNSVAANSTAVVVGAHFDDTRATDAGIAYVFDGLPANTAPIAVDDSLIAEEDLDLFIDVLADNGNGADTDPDNNLDPMLTVELTSTTNGALTNNFDGTFFYTPNPEFSGTDSFTYQIEDTDGATSFATVSINVLPVNDAPSFTIGPGVTISEDSGPQTFAGNLPQSRVYWVNNAPGTRTIESALLNGADRQILASTTGIADQLEIDQASGKMYWHDNGIIKRSNLNGSNQETIASGLSSFGALDIDFENGKIYYVTRVSTSTGNWRRMLNRMNLDGSSQEALFEANPEGIQNSVVNDLVVDADNNFIYWLNGNGGDSIGRATIDGGGTDQIVLLQNTGIGAPIDIHINPTKTHLYWSSNNTQNSIQRIGTDGQGIETLLTGVQLPLGLDIDFENEQMYWTNGEDSDAATPGYQGTIQRSNLDGSAVETLIDGLDTGSSFIYLTSLAVGIVDSPTGDAWATDISAGPNEESQQLTFLVTTNSDPSLFSAQPEISPEGVLTFTPAPGANGNSLLSVILVDDGGTDNGGLDSSDEQFFEIIIAASNDQPQFDQNSYTFSLDENSELDAMVDSVSATDPDPSDFLTYSIVGGNTDGAFKIDASGNIQVDNFEAIDYETNPTFNLTVQVDDNSGEANSTDTASVTINLNDLQATIAIADATPNQESYGSATFDVTFTGDDIRYPVDVSYETMDGTAVSTSAGVGSSDYTSDSGTLNFGGFFDGEQLSIDVFFGDDAIVEDDETFYVRLLSATGNDVTFTRDLGQATIENDDSASLTIGDQSVIEGTGGTTTMSFDVTLDAQVQGGFTVEHELTFLTADASDLSLTTASPVIFSGSTLAETQTIEVDIATDAMFEADETFKVDLGPVANTSAVQSAAISLAVPELLLENYGDGSGGIIADTTSALLARIEVGSSDVPITHLETFGILSADGLAKAIIWEGDSPAPVSNPVFQSDAYAVSQSGAQWYSSPRFSYTLQANRVYHVGVAFDQPFSYFYESTTTTNSANGLTSPKNNGSTQGGTFDNPRLANTAGGIQTAMRLVNAPLASAIGTIVNDDSATLTVGDATVTEGDSGTVLLSFPVNLNQPVDVDVSFDYQTQDGTATSSSDFTGVISPATFTLPAGSTTGQINIVVNGDGEVEIDETVRLIVSNLQSSGRDVEFSDTVIDQSNLDDRGAASPSSSLTWQQEVIVAEDGQLSGLTVFTSGPGDFNLSINLGTPLQSDPDDFSTVVTATAAGAQFVDLSAENLDLVAGDRFAFKLNGINDGPTGGFRTTTNDSYPGRFYLNGSQRTTTDFVFQTHMTQVGVTSMPAEGTIVNDDQASLSVSDISQPENGIFEFTVTTDTIVNEDITFAWGTFQTSGQAVYGTDFAQIAIEPASIPAGSTSTTFTVPVVNDSIVEPDEFFRIQIYNEGIAGVASPSRVTIGQRHALGMIENDDSATLTVGDASVTEGDSGTTTLSFPVTLSQPVDVDVSFDYQTQDGSATSLDADFVDIPPVLTYTFAAGTTTGLIDIVVNGDNKVELDETLRLVVSNLQASGRDVQFAETIPDQDNAPTNTGAIVGSDTYTYHRKSSLARQVYWQVLKFSLAELEISILQCTEGRPGRLTHLISQPL